MPQAYREGYLRDTARRHIAEDAERHDITERGHLIEGMRRVMDIVQLLLRGPDRPAQETLSDVLDQLIQFTGAERGILFRILELEENEEVTASDETEIVQDWTPSHQRRWRVVISVARGFGQQDLDNKRARASRTVIRRILEHGLAVFSADTTEDARFSQSGSIANLGMRSILAFPLRSDHIINGVVYLDSPYGQQFSDTEMELLEVLGNQLGPVVEVTHQRENVQVVSETFPRILGRSPSLLNVLQSALKVAHTNVSVLILGETGTGKDLLARGIHEASPRVHKPFVPINCAALPENLIESELFGHVKGAFTGAHSDKAGLFEQANNGTLFLDEIGDLPMTAQAKLLRVLQEGMVRRVGDKRDRPVDVRVLAATHWNLEELVHDKRFRSDLYYRLNVVPLRLPPLRERREDIPSLVRFFFGLFVEQYELVLAPPSPKIVRALQQFPWPGNIRQLKNALQQAMLICNKSELTLEAIQSAADAVEERNQQARQYPNITEANSSTTPLPEQGPPSWAQPPGQSPMGQSPVGQPYGQFPPGQMPFPHPTQGQAWPSNMAQHPMGNPNAAWPPQAYWPGNMIPPGAVPQGAVPQSAQGGWNPSWQQAQAMQAQAMQAQQAQAMQMMAQGMMPWWMQMMQNNPMAPQTTPAPAPEPAAPTPPASNYLEAKALHRYQMATQALARAGGNKSEAARLMGISRRAFYRILNAYKEDKNQ